MLWDVFCRVVDNLGDVGFSWRLGADLAARGEQVRLWIDDASALGWMAPGGHAGVDVAAFDAAGEPGDVVVETFGCDLPPAFVERMATRRPVWVDVEYFSAEGYVERSHGLPSPQPGGLTKWFFFPGVTAATGGLLREPGLLAERDAFDRAAWLAAHGLQAAPGERVVTLFCYANPALPAMLQALGAEPTLLLAAPGAAQQQVNALAATLPATIRSRSLSYLSQRDFDRLLWASDINFVRGEDSLVRAIWAGKPFVWNIYPQQDGAHVAKLHALLGRLPAVAGLAATWDAWNGVPDGGDWPPWPAFEGWRAAAGAACDRLAAQPGLTHRLVAFARGKQGAGC